MPSRISKKNEKQNGVPLPMTQAQNCTFAWSPRILEGSRTCETVKEQVVISVNGDVESFRKLNYLSKIERGEQLLGLMTSTSKLSEKEDSRVF